MRDASSCAICALSLALALFALGGLGMLELERRGLRLPWRRPPRPPAPPPPLLPPAPAPPAALAPAEPEPVPPTPSAVDTPGWRPAEPSVPDLSGLGAPAWGGPYDDRETERERLPAGPTPGEPRGFHHAAPTEPLPAKPPRPKAPPWGSGPGPATTVSQSRQEIAAAIEADAKKIRDSIVDEQETKE